MYIRHNYQLSNGKNKSMSMLCAICNSEQQFFKKMRIAYVIEVCLYKGT